MSDHVAFGIHATASAKCPLCDRADCRLGDVRIVALIDRADEARAAIAHALASAGLTVVAFDSAEEFLLRAVVLGPHVGCVLSELNLPGLSGLGLLRLLPSQQIAAPVVFLTAGASIDSAVSAVRAGALDVLEKPCATRTIVNRVEWALAYTAARDARHAA